LLSWHPSQAEIDGARSCGAWPSTTAVTFCRPLAGAMQRGNLLTESEQTPDSNQRLTEPNADYPLPAGRCWPVVEARRLTIRRQPAASVISQHSLLPLG